MSRGVRDFLPLRGQEMEAASPPLCLPACRAGCRAAASSRVLRITLRAMAFGRRVTPDVYVVVDGTLIPIGRVAAYRPRCCGEHLNHGMNLRVIARPGWR
jgi:hypothetical protein